MLQQRTLTTGQIARLLGINFLTVIRWIRRGYLKGYQLPGRGDNRVTVPDFLDFLKKHDLPVPRELQRRTPLVLVVDDDPDMARAMQRVLQKAGFEVRVAADGFEAGAILGTLVPDVMTLDLHMPGLDGHKVIRLVRETKELERIKILVVSGLPKKELQRAIKEGADGSLRKPFENTVLVEKIVELASIHPIAP